ncbi:MAG: hypothetical protein QXK47_04890, partial [Candidatus Bathyarchaeia archaeon]
PFFGGVTPLFYVFIILVVAGILAWKYKAIKEFIVIVCSTVGGFILGSMITETGYINIGLGMASAVAGLLLSTATVAVIRMLRPKGHG